MDDNRIVARLDRIVEGVEKIVTAIPGPASRFRHLERGRYPYKLAGRLI
jgi:hypothetical protein